MADPEDLETYAAQSGRYRARLELTVEELLGIADTISAPGATAKGTANGIRGVVRKICDTLKR